MALALAHARIANGDSMEDAVAPLVTAGQSRPADADCQAARVVACIMSDRAIDIR